ncbi:MAG: site-specific integrase [Candidatus Pacearchaeota archaeon]
MPRYYIKKEDFKIVSLDEIKRYIDACEREDMKILLMLSWLTGARISEIIELKKSNFSIGKNYITILIHSKKHGKVGYPTFSFNDPFIQNVLEYIKDKGEEERIFKCGKRRYQQILLQLNKKLHGEDKSKYITFHYLRHSRLTYLARVLGAMPEELKSWTGHKSTAFEEYFAPRRVRRFAGKIK